MRFARFAAATLYKDLAFDVIRDIETEKWSKVVQSSGAKVE